MYRLAARLRTHLHDRTRGQSLVEFALVLPIIMLLLMTALDFGRVYLGYINLQNMARIASNFAANNPTAWTVSSDPVVQARNVEAQVKYRNEILGDAVATNCNLPVVAGKSVVPIPTFKHTDGSTTTDPRVGDNAQVGITCTFGVITPVISNIVGGTVQVSAASTFPVKVGMTSAVGAAPGGTPPNAAFSGNGTYTPAAITGTTPFTVDFRDTSGGNPTSWLWTFHDTNPVTTSTSRDVLGHVFAQHGTWAVDLEARNYYGSTTTTMFVTVVDPTDVDFTFTQAPMTAPSVVAFTSNSSPGGTNYAWTFGTGQGGDSGASKTTTSHTYNTAGTFSVTLTVTYATGPVFVTKTLSVNPTLCIVPSLDHVKFSDAQGAWTARGFTGTVTRDPSAPSGDFSIKSQSEVGGDSKPCSIGVVVNNK